jgi:hypothetical protein
MVFVLLVSDSGMVTGERAVYTHTIFRPYYFHRIQNINKVIYGFGIAGQSRCLVGGGFINVVSKYNNSKAQFAVCVILFHYSPVDQGMEVNYEQVRTIKKNDDSSCRYG